MLEDLKVPPDLLPQDGRFGSGPSKVTDRQMAALQAAQPHLMGTSHRAAPVKALVGDVRTMIGEFFSLPDGYEVVLGLGGASAFWDVAAFSLVREKAQHCAFGEFGAKFATATSSAPHLASSSIRTAEPGGAILPEAEDGIDVYAWAHNETSTGAMVTVERPAGIGDALVVVDGTSAAGGIHVDIAETDVYYFSPQKGLASDGGLWFAIMSPAALARAAEIAASDRYIPGSLSLQGAIDSSRLNQTINTPAIATLVMARAQLEWLIESGGMSWAAARTADSSGRIYNWASEKPHTVPFVTNPSNRSQVVVTLDLKLSIESGTVRGVLRENGIVDVDPYRKLGRNQLRIGTYPAVDPEDASALTRTLEWILERFDDYSAAGGTPPS